MRNLPVVSLIRIACVAIIVLPLAACPLSTRQYDSAMLDQKMGLDTLARVNFTRAAKAGNAEAQNMMGWYWANGLGGLPKSTVEACNWYAEAESQGLAA
jgi:TPR repeat protein